MFEDVSAERALAAAVVEQALNDLTVVASPRMKPTAAARLELDRASAKRFLLVELWDPDCLWGALLSLNQEAVKAAVMRRLS